MNNYLIRKIKDKELHLLEDFLYEVIFQSDESNLLPRNVIKKPEISVYIDNWGKRGDHCFVALVKEKVIGAVWTRILDGTVKGYGNIDSQTPEFAISLYKEYRNQGIGTALMKKMIELLKIEGYSKTSLSVAKDNYAFKLYMNLGFEIYKEKDNDYLMVLKLFD